MRGPESELLIRLFRAGIAAADPATCLPPFLPDTPPAGRTVVSGAGRAVARTLVLGAGKGAARMAATVAAHHFTHRLGPVCGAVVTRYGHGLLPGEQSPGIEILEAGHPVPDNASVAAGTRLLELARASRPADRCIVLLSGGASALLVQPAQGITLADKQDVTRRLLESGASIGEINAVRRKLSVIKGGGLARQIRAGEILLCAISDVPGNVIADIGSGPLSRDPGTLADARAIIARYGIVLTPSVAGALADSAHAKREAASPAAFPQVDARIVASSATALAAAARAAEQAGWPAHVLPDVRGPARDVARHHAALIHDLRARKQRAAVISGGETTVSVTRADGRGGRNGEYLLSLALALGKDAGVHALAGDTDGVDGTGDNAGALLTPDTLDRAARSGHDATDALAAQRSYNFFAALNDLVVTGPTRTNVNDLRIILAA